MPISPTLVLAKAGRAAAGCNTGDAAAAAVDDTVAAFAIGDAARLDFGAGAAAVGFTADEPELRLAVVDGTGDATVGFGLAAAAAVAAATAFDLLVTSSTHALQRSISPFVNTTFATAFCEHL
jgi:hypothetical protein